jgi:hypothetical protein
MSEFKKYDDGKLKFSLIEPTFIEGIAKVLTDASYEYGENNWKTIDQNELVRYKDALMRHMYSYMKGNIFDDKSKQHEMLHIACNAMFLFYFDTQRSNTKSVIQEKSTIDSLLEKIQRSKFELTSQEVFPIHVENHGFKPL